MNATHLKVVHPTRPRTPALHSAMTLGREDLIALELQPGDRLRSDCGTLWLTVDGEQRDVLVEAGQVHRAERAGIVNVSALREACLVVLSRQPLRWHRVSAMGSGWLSRALAGLSSAMATLVRHLQSPPQHAAGR